MRGRVKGLLGGGAAEDIPEQASAPMEPMPGFASPDAQRQALQVLTLAQRTADEHIATAQQQADRIRGEARATAEQITREAQAQAENARREGAKALSDARGSAEQIGVAAQAHADGLRRDGEKALSDARARAAEIVKDAQGKAADLDKEAQQRYEEVVGSLATKRDALQEKIDALQQFDRDYRSRLRTFMERQLHELGAEEPRPNGEILQPDKAAPKRAARG